MIKIEQDITDLNKDGQSGRYKNFVRSYTGRVRRVIEMKNPLSAAIMVDDINRILEILNPALEKEIAWFQSLQKLLKLWHNEMVIANRLLGIKNDNQYDMRVFEKVVVDKFFIELKGKAPGPDMEVKTDFKTMIELVELGARRFGH